MRQTRLNSASLQYRIYKKNVHCPNEAEHLTLQKNLYKRQCSIAVHIRNAAVINIRQFQSSMSVDEIGCGFHVRSLHATKKTRHHLLHTVTVYPMDSYSEIGPSIRRPAVSCSSDKILHFQERYQLLFHRRCIANYKCS